jgi:hypothetical protein
MISGIAFTVIVLWGAIKLGNALCAENAAARVARRAAERERCAAKRRARWEYQPAASVARDGSAEGFAEWRLVDTGRRAPGALHGSMCEWRLADTADE